MKVQLPEYCSTQKAATPFTRNRRKPKSSTVFQSVSCHLAGESGRVRMECLLCASQSQGNTGGIIPWEEQGVNLSAGRAKPVVSIHKCFAQRCQGRTCSWIPVSAAYCD